MTDDTDKLAVCLKDGVTYADGWGELHTVMGPCRDYPEWCWTNTGYWFERLTGTRIDYDPTTGTHSVGGASWRNLWKEV